MAKKKPEVIWICRDVSQGSGCEIYPEEPEELGLDPNDPWNFTWRPTQNAIQLCTRMVERFLGERLPEWPNLAEVSMRGFRIVKIWAPVEDPDDV